jgi:acyl dehydratase
VAAAQKISARGHAEPPRWHAAANASTPVRKATPPRPAWLGVSILLALAPFERLQALVRVPGQQVSNVEALLFVVLAAWAVALSFRLTRRSTGRSTGRAEGQAVATFVNTPLTAPWIALILAMLLAAFVVPPGDSLQGNALNMVGRYGLAFLVYLLTVDATADGRLDGLLAVGVALGLVLAALVLLDFWGLPGVRAWLRQFRTGISLVGSQVRATGPFQYPTIASMYLEVLFALGLGFLLLMLERGRQGAAAIVVITLLLIGQAVVLTFTRAGLLTLLSSLAIVAALRVRERGADRAVIVLGALAVAIGVQFVASRSLDAVRLRLSTEGQDEWYHASFDAPRRIEVPAGGIVAVPLSVTNTGRVTWDPGAPQRFRLSYHWLLAEDDRVVSWEGLRADFRAPVKAGDTVTIVARVQAPREPGTYRVLWDLEEEHRLWFSTEPDARLFTSEATVTGASAGARDPGALKAFPSSASRPGRLVLWRAAGRMLVDRPWTGVGPDNFRLLYGGYAGLANADRRVHSNNLYLELLVSGGLVAGVVLVWFFWRVAMVSWRAVVPRAVHPAAPGVVAAVAAVAVHGVFDAFLAFTATYILTAITLGLAVGLSVPVSPDPQGAACVEGA